MTRGTLRGWRGRCLGEDSDGKMCMLAGRLRIRLSARKREQLLKESSERGVPATQNFVG
jgi:hypothetical protein